MWKSGSTTSTRSGGASAGRWPVTQMRYIETAAVRLAWVSTAALGTPVVAPVYCRRAMSSGDTAGQADGIGAFAIRRSRTSGAAPTDVGDAVTRFARPIFSPPPCGGVGVGVYGPVEPSTPDPPPRP